MDDKLNITRPCYIGRILTETVLDFLFVVCLVLNIFITNNLSIKLFSYLHQNPGFDFSGAEISGNYSKGGPDFSSLEK